MDRLIIEGGVPLKGEVTIAGAKNAALGLIPATILANDVCTLENLPNIKDVNRYMRLLENIGAKIDHIDGNAVQIDTTGIKNTDLLDDETQKMRASYYMI
ncbi:MAG TPA: UDP-N-acetylglucosamine 1-carboxyvinyltransferase, partial [Eubacteriaceae bacterium]|nr:UDP-N-acetylglucosamine 1-carboxyvinyltransferase [Eubacteriaceae bacterium]